MDSTRTTVNVLKNIKKRFKIEPSKSVKLIKSHMHTPIQTSACACVPQMGPACVCAHAGAHVHHAHKCTHRTCAHTNMPLASKRSASRSVPVPPGRTLNSLHSTPPILRREALQGHNMKRKSQPLSAALQAAFHQPTNLPINPRAEAFMPLPYSPPLLQPAYLLAVAPG